MAPTLFPLSPNSGRGFTPPLPHPGTFPTSFGTPDYLILPNFVIVLVKTCVSLSFIFFWWLLVCFIHLLSLICVVLSPFPVGLSVLFIYFKIYLFLERGEGRERNINIRGKQLAASCTSPTGDLACNPGMGNDWEWSQQPFGL